MAELKKLCKTRSSIKAKLTHFTNFINIIKSYKILSLPHKIELKNRLKVIDDAYEDFNKLQTEIELLSDDSEKEFAEREQFENLYYENSAYARSVLENPLTVDDQAEPGSIKALHLELVSDLTKECFLGALDRFIARRGKPQTIYCDNGTTFVGAFNYLMKHCRNDIQGIQFKHIPAYTAHFGGLWENSVKAVKFHLVRILGRSHLTYEEMITCLAQIESILNSRPLTPISSDPSDLTYLTPSHFLIGRSLTSVPHPEVGETNITRLQRFQRVELLKQHFWKRYANEYVSLLQQKTKWKSSSGKLRSGAMVIIKDKAAPPMMWQLGRIVRLIPGNDGIARVADVQTSKGIIRRAYNNICLLPVDAVEEEASSTAGCMVAPHAFSASQDGGGTSGGYNI
ncbi:uncharacterized protein LOC114360986 isoform X7 [Ostrinia furnacalis]|uniref:uncharacterized protein LOC114360986 isoform X7 n=1 Tax=Ostrinia furnacalis TaxID=93504 RepID=UPI00103D75B6|nr:uncharacterized protein LOC114360986 isoform X7 [Ostrinia furnacalis]